MSRMTTTKSRHKVLLSGYLPAILGHVIALAVCLCLCAQNGYAQPIDIRSDQVGGLNGNAALVNNGHFISTTLYDIYFPTYFGGLFDPNYLNTWHLQLGNQFPRGGLRIYGAGTFRFDGDLRNTLAGGTADLLTVDGGAIYIHEGDRYDFSARYGFQGSSTIASYLRSFLVFENNITSGSGGAVSITRTDVNFTNVQFYNNSTVPLGSTILTSGGGAVHNVGGNIIFTDAAFGSMIDMVRPATPGQTGTVVDRTPTGHVRGGNTTVASGGAIHSTGGTLSFNANARDTIETRAIATGQARDANTNTTGTNPVETYIYGVTQLPYRRDTMRNHTWQDRITVQPWSDGFTSPTLSTTIASSTGFESIIIASSANSLIGNTAGTYGGAIYGDGTNMTFTARAVAAATANANATASNSVTGGDQVQSHATAYAETLVTSFGFGGYFRGNEAGISGGAIYSRGGTLEFEADASATARATATATAAVNASIAA